VKRAIAEGNYVHALRLLVIRLAGTIGRVLAKLKKIVFMSEFEEAKRVWDDIARNDPLWGILTDQTKAGRRWDHAEFFSTGRREIRVVLDHLRSIGHLPATGEALDFGCGVGRLTLALADHFNEVHGVDVSEKMIAEANAFNSEKSNCQYHVNDRPDLKLFPNSKFDFIYSSIVLQHIPVRHVRDYLQEFLRILKPKAILVFQLPERFVVKTDPALTPWHQLRRKLRLRTRLREFLEGIGLRQRARVAGEMQMNSLSENKIRNLINGAGGHIVDVQLTNSAEAAFNGNLQFLESEPTEGWISKQYCVVK